MPSEGSRNPLQPIQPYGAVPQAANPAAADYDMSSTVETGATVQANASKIRTGSNRTRKKGSNLPVRPASKRISKPTEKKQVDKEKKKGEEPWAVDEELSVMLREVAKARKRAKLPKH